MVRRTESNDVGQAQRRAVVNEQETARYKAYIAWRRLTHNGHRSRDQMSLKEQAEFDAFALGGVDTRPRC